MRSFFAKKNSQKTPSSAFAEEDVFRLLQMRKISWGKNKKKVGREWDQTRDLKFAGRCLTHYSITPSMTKELSLPYIYKKQKYFFRVRKKFIK